MHIGIVVLSWRAVHTTLACIRAVAELTTTATVRVVLVNNDADHGTSRQLQALINERYPEVKLVLSPVNLGFGGGMNLGVQTLLDMDEHFDFFWFLNNDARPEPDSLSELLTYACSYPNKKIIGPTIIEHDRDLVQCAGGCYYNTWLGMDSACFKGLSLNAVREQPAPSFDYIYGAAMLVRAEFFLSCGMFQPQYFLYFEELALASSCKPDDLGWCVGARVRHVGGESATNPVITAFCAYHAALSCFRFTLSKAWYKLPTVILARIIGKSCHALWSRDPLLVKAVWLAVWDLIRNKTRTDVDAF